MLAALVAVVAAANGVAALIGDLYLQVAIGALSLVGVASVAVLQFRELGAERSEKIEETVPRGVKRVRELSREDAGVTPEAPEALAALSRSTGDKYLIRDVDDQLDAQLKAALTSDETQLVVLAGPSKAGKTRTLFEAMSRQLANAEWIAPADADALEELMKPGGMPKLVESTAVLWLDDLELYVRFQPHGMNPDVLTHLAADDRRWIVLATAGGKGVTQAGDRSEFSVPMEDLLRHATEIRLPPHLSAGERERLQDYAPEAAERIAEEGIGEYMITGRELIRKLESGSHNYGAPPCPQGQAVANAAIDWQRAGILDPIPRAVLRQAYENYLVPEDVDPSDDGFDEGLAWARKPLYSTVALLSGRDGFRPHDLIVDSVPETRAINETAWLCFLEAADPLQAFNLGTLAYARSHGDGETDWATLSQQANRKTLESDRTELRAYAASNLGVVLADCGDFRGAAEAYRQAFDLGLVEAQVYLGILLLDKGKKRKAREAFELADQHESAAGAFRLGVLMLEVGDDLADAEPVLLRSEERGHPIAALILGGAYEEHGEVDKAEAAYRRGDAAGTVEGAEVLAGFLEEKRGKQREAFEVWKRADERGSATGALVVGMHLDAIRDRDRAKAAFRRGAERGNDDCAQNLGALYFEDGDEEEAEIWFRLADELGHARGAFNHGIMLVKNGKMDEAEAAFRRAGQRGHPKGAELARGVKRGDVVPKR